MKLSEPLNLRHRIAKAIVVWLLKHSGVGAMVEADAAETTALIAGVRSDLGAVESVAVGADKMVRLVIGQSNRTIPVVNGILEKHQAWEAADKNLMNASRRLAAQRKRIADREAAKANLAAAPIEEAATNTELYDAPDPAVVGQGQAV